MLPVSPRTGALATAWRRVVRPTVDLLARALQALWRGACRVAAAALDATRADEAASAGWLLVAALDDLQGACDAALSRRDAPDELAPAYDTFLAAMTSLLELVGG